MRRIALLLLVLGFSVFSCENPLEDRVNDLENQLAEYEQQQVLIDSLINVLFVQQAIIDSLHIEQQIYIDSLDSKQQAYIDSLNAVQQLLIDMLISGQPITGTGDNYVRINNVQICWGGGLTDINGSTVTFASSFAEIPIVVMSPTADEQLIINVKDITTSSATFYLNIGAKKPFNYQAIGFWY